MPTFEQEEIGLLRNRVSRLEAQLDYVYKHLGITFSEDGSPSDDPQVVAALRAHSMIEAIKYYRLKTNVGLAEAKSAVEEIRARLGL